MSNMNDQYEQMGRFCRSLMEFNDRLRTSMKDLERCHDHVSPYWQDEMRRHYDVQWQPMYDVIKHYAAVEGPSYVEFLHIKHYSLERYLRG